MSAQISAYGRLGRDPKQIETKSGKSMASSSIAVTTPTRDDDSATIWFSVLAFGKIADILSKHEKGDLISLSGRVQANNWTDNEGLERNDIQIIADSVVSARTVRPKASQNKQNNKPNNPQQYPDEFELKEFDDEITF